MSHSPSFVRPLLLAILVAAGIAIAWFFVGLIGISTMLGFKNRPHEQIYVHTDGRPVILRTARSANLFTQQMLSLDREPLETDAQHLLHPHYVSGPHQSGPQQGVTWSSRIAGANDGHLASVYWYLIHDGRTNGRAYGVGYHARSGMIVGYFGKQGFSERQPPRDEWFQVFSDRCLEQMTTGTSGAEPNWLTYQNYRGLALLADGKLWSVDLAGRNVTALADCPNAFSLGWAWLPRPTDGQQRMAASSDTERKLLVRQHERLLLVDPLTGEQRTVPLPADLRPTMLSAFEFEDRRLLLVSLGLSGGAGTVTWLDPEGQVTSQRNVPLSSYRDEPDAGQTAWDFALAAPYPLANGLFTLAYPARQVGSGQADSLANALSDLLQQAWPALVLVLGIGVACAVAAYRRQRHYSLPHAAGWAVFAFVMGIPGWIAYRLHRNWPALEPCPSCNEPAPIDRAACADCGATFPPPALMGIEVFG
jgi:hypothetical protein